MTTKDDIKKIVNESFERSKLNPKLDHPKYAPIYEILTFTNPDQEMIRLTGSRSGFPDMGPQNAVGYYHDLDDAYDAIVSNACDIWETCYNAAFLLCRFPGLYNCVAKEARMYFVYNKETGEYEQKEEPAIFAHIAL